MSNDIYKAVNFNAGQEVRYGDLLDSQKFLAARLTDQVLNYLTPGVLTAAGDPDLRTATESATKWAYALTLGGGSPVIGGTGTDKKVKISAGTLLQKVGAVSGDDSTLIPYTFAGTEEVTLNDGHITLPRVDLVQMKLEWETGDSQSRVFDQEALYATIDFGALVANLDTILRANNRGVYGNHISVRLVAGGGLAYAEAGNLVTITFVTGVTTVADVEALVVAQSNILEIEAAGTPGNILVSPDDVLAYTALDGGAEQLLLDQNFDMKRRVKCTLSVVVGTPAAAPAVIPDPTAGYVPIAAVVVHPTWDGTGGFNYDDHPTASATATIMDLRMPVNVKRHTVLAKDAVYDDAYWKARGGRSFVSAWANEANFINCHFVDANFDDTAGPPVNSGWQRNGGQSQYMQSQGAAARAVLNIPVSPGMRITGIEMNFYGTPTSDLDINAEINRQSTQFEILDDTESNIGAAWTGASLGVSDGVNPWYDVDDNETLCVIALASEAGVRIQNCIVFWTPIPDPDAVSTDLLVPCPGNGRLLALRVTSEDAGDPTSDLPETAAYLCGWSLATTDLQKVGGYTGDLFADTTAETIHGGLDVIEDSTHCEAEAAKGSATYGMPIWSSGVRAPRRHFEDEGDGSIAGHLPMLALRVTKHDNPSNVKIYRVTFFVAEGM